jgi:ribonuclease HII
MDDLDGEWPAYDFKTHKGYITPTHSAALTEHGPCPVHRMRFVNVRRAAGLEDAAGMEEATVAEPAGL